MFWDNNKINDEDMEEEEDDEECQLIDPNDINIIEDSNNWHPGPEYIIAYAKQLGYDEKKDPKEILNIAEKYLTLALPLNIKRAFYKENLQILYIDMNTQEIQLETDLEKQAKEEFDQIRKMKQGGKDPAPIPTKSINRNIDDNINDKQDDIDNESNEEIRLEDNTESIKINEEKRKKNKKDKKDGLKNMKNNINKNNKRSNPDFDDCFDLDRSSNDENNDNEKNNLAMHLNLKTNDDEEQEEDENDIIKKNYKKGKEDDNISDKEEDQKITAIRNKKKQKEKEMVLNLNDSDESKDNIIINEKNKINKRDDSKLKKNYLEINKKKLENFKTKMKKEYISNKKDFIENFNKRKLKDSKNKIKKELSKEQNENLKNYENTLKEKMGQDLEQYKKNLLLDLEKKLLKNSSQNEINESKEKNDLEIKKMSLESNIRIQKERNSNKKESELIKNKNILEDKKSSKEEIMKRKKSNLELENKNKLLSLEKDFERNFEKEKHKFMSKQKELYLPIKAEKNIINDVINEYSKQLKEKFEEEKIMINIEFEQKLEKDLENYKIKLKKEREDNIKQINDDINNLGKNYYLELDIIKEENNSNNKKEEEFTKNNIQKASELFDVIKNKYNNNIDIQINEIKNLIKNLFENNYNDFNNGTIEIKVEELIIDKLSKEKLKLNKLKSFIDLAEKDYMNKEIDINYISKAILLVCKLLNEKSNIFDFGLEESTDLKNKDDDLVNEITYNIKNFNNDFQMKFNINDHKNKIYSFLNKELKKLMDSIDKENEKKNININNVFKYTNNNKFKFASNNQEMDLNQLINKKDNEINNNYKSNFQNIFKNINTPNSLNLVSSRNFNNRYDFNSALLGTERIKNINNTKSIADYSIGLNNINNNYMNKNNSLISRDNNNHLNNENINENEENDNISPSEFNPNFIISQLPNEILNNFSDELLNIYKRINDFLTVESNKLSEEIKDLGKKKEAYKKLKEIKESRELDQYNNFFNQIYINEKNNSNKSKRNLEDKLKIFNMIKSNYEEALDFLNNNLNRQDIFKEKLNILLMHINDYYENYNSNRNKVNNLNDYNIHQLNLNPSFSNRKEENFSKNKMNLINNRYGNNNFEYNNNNNNNYMKYRGGSFDISNYKFD